ncbi:hypothetical protein [Mesorhizobium sp. M0187]|uniref:hypothetical protein n=1 Tax=Mesorhizobium sp. M0187 TaxID=2956908 RepID=UPI003334E300
MKMTGEQAVAAAEALADRHIENAVEQIARIVAEHGGTDEEIESAMAHQREALSLWKQGLMGDVERFVADPEAAPGLN